MQLEFNASNGVKKAQRLLLVLLLEIAPLGSEELNRS